MLGVCECFRGVFLTLLSVVGVNVLGVFFCCCYVYQVHVCTTFVLAVCTGPALRILMCTEAVHKQPYIADLTEVLMSKSFT